MESSQSSTTLTENRSSPSSATTHRSRMSPRFSQQPRMHLQNAPDIRKFSHKQRKVLGVGPVLRLYAGDQYVMAIPFNLFYAATTQPELVDDNFTIRLPPDTGVEAILSIGCHLIALTTNKKFLKLRGKNDLEADLRICKAARLLGLEKYIQHIHNKYWWMLHNRPLEPAHVEVILKVALDFDDPFLRLIGHIITRSLREGTTDNVGWLREYVDGNPMLKSVVADMDEQHHTQLETPAKKATRTTRREVSKEVEPQTGPAHHTTEDAVREARLKGRLEVQRTAECEDQREDQHAYHERQQKFERTKAKWEDRRKKEAQLSLSLQEKMRLGKNVAVVTREEARYYERTKGKRCPYKISG